MRFSATVFEPLVLDEKCRRVVSPAIDVLERHDDYIIYCAMPGVPKDEITLYLDHDELVIEGEARLDPPHGMHVHSLEFCSALYRLRLALPGDSDSANISAKYSDGVLTLTLPRKKQTLVKRVNVKPI